MTTGAVTASIDLAQIVLYMFWIFFAGLCLYLHRESKREGYPLVADGPQGRAVFEGFPGLPEPKTFLMRDGTTKQAPPGSGPDPREHNLERSREYPGNPYDPIGNPLLAGVGPGSYALRADVPDLTLDNLPRIVPLRVAPSFDVDAKGTDPRGFTVRGADGGIAGDVVDLWIDRSEHLFRFLEIQLDAGGRVLLPINFASITANRINVSALLGHQFADVPTTKSTDEITLLEEERITAYYGAGTLYAEPSRLEPLI
jgi:photosynthetic reaction center H subunit